MRTPERLQPELPLRWVVMGVSGTGKSTVGRALAARLDYAYAEGDDDHPQANIDKMAAGIPLTDADRHDWLLRLQQRLRHAAQNGTPLVLSCSALKRRYRDLLRQADPELVFVHLDGEKELIAQRMHNRSGHFMPAALLDSQLRDLEPLQVDERGIRLDIAEPPAVLAARAVQQFQANPAS